MKSLIRLVLTSTLFLALPNAFLPSCAKSAAQAQRYHCPMHPTYVSDQPGDCPICGMRLVPIDGKKGNLTYGQVAGSASPSGPASGHERAAPEHQDWTCPMDPEVHSDKPGRCPKCGMKLEAKATNPEQASHQRVPGLAPIDVSKEGLSLAGVRTEIAQRGRIARTIRAVGVVRADETRVRHVHTKISGWIEKLYVNFTGEPVVSGRPILAIFSQELLAAQHEYLQARNATVALQRSDLSAMHDGADGILTAAARRLELLDVPKRQIEELDRNGTPSRTIVLSAPVSGIVMSKNAFEGQQVEPGTELFTVTDLSRVWLEGEIYESESAAVRVGQEGRITFVNDPTKTLKSTIKYVYPYLNAETRTLRVRFVLPNPDLRFKLESYATVEIPVEADEGVIIPDSAVMDTGVRQVVFVNTSGGHFEPRLVRVGIRADGRAQILSGIAPGESVAVKANFLLDSESRLQSALMPNSATVWNPSGAASSIAPSPTAQGGAGQ